MRINNNHRLLFSNGKAVPFDETVNKSGTLKGGKPKYVIIHYTAGGSAKSATDTFKKPERQASAHFVLGHDGTITQMAKLNEKCWHAGRSKWKNLTGLNSHSVGIEIVNWGWLKGGPGNWRSWVGTPIDDNRVIEATHKNGGVTRGWEIYPEAQVMACVDIVRAMVEKYNLGPECILGHDDISPGRKQDPGPAWDMDKFRSLVLGRADDDGDIASLYHVESQSGLNMRKGAGISFDTIKTLKNGTQVLQIETQGAWWLVTEIVANKPDITGWVHSYWLRRD